MYSIKMYGVKAEDRPFAERWAQKHQVKLAMTTDVINEDTIDDARGFDGVTTLQVTDIPREAYARFHAMGVKQIAQRSAGYDMYDLAEATKNHIIISNVPSYSPESIAEYALTTALNLVRRVPQIQQRVAAHNFTWQTPIRGRVIGKMTIAVLGTGRIGAHAARLFHGIGAKVISFDRHQNPALTGIVTYVDSIEEAVAQADLVSLHMPANNANHHLFDANMFQHFKRGAYLVNTARGSLIDTQALLNALTQGQLAGAGLDVYEHEGPIVPLDLQGQPLADELFKQLLASDRVIYSPHVAYYTDEAVANLIEGGLDATLDVILHGDTANRVNDLA